MNKSAIEVISYDKCTGCYGCYNICPVDGAIEFKRTEEGFYKPFLTEKCIQCGVCQKGCPVITKVNNNKKEDLEVYSSWSKDENIIKNSSSGGIFSELAKKVLKNNGIVFGAKWSNGEIVHSSIDKIENLYELQKSKYLQSKIENSYKEVKEFLKEGKTVLFVGTPCEIGALNTIVKDERLIAVDLVCHGIPSYNTYDKYIEENFKENKEDITVDFRNKDTGWENFNLTFKNKDKEILKNHHQKDIWFRGFLRNIYLNKPCYNCEFRTLPRYGDITLGDFWGVPEELKNPLGTSVITVNSKKGKELLEKIKGNIVLKEANFDLAYKGNPCLYNYEMKDTNREKFFKDFKNLKFIELHKKYFPFPNKYIFFIRRILGFTKRKINKVLGIKK